MPVAHHRAMSRSGIAAAALAAVLLLTGCPAGAEDGDDDSPQQPVPGATTGEDEAENGDEAENEAEDDDG